MSTLVARSAPLLASLHVGTQAQRTGVIWRPGLLVTSAANLPEERDVTVVFAGGVHGPAQLLGLDPSFEIAVYTVEARATELPPVAEPSVGSMAVLMGAAEYGAPSARLAMVHGVGPSWIGRGGGRIDRLISLDARLSSWEEGALVLDAVGDVLGMALLTSRHRVLLLPPTTVDRSINGLVSPESNGRAWLGLGLQPVSVPTPLQERVGKATGLLVTKLAHEGPGQLAGILPGDIMLEVNGRSTARRHDVAAAVATEPAGQRLTVALLRGGVPLNVSIVAAARPATR